MSNGDRLGCLNGSARSVGRVRVSAGLSNACKISHDRFLPSQPTATLPPARLATSPLYPKEDHQPKATSQKAMLNVLLILLVTSATALQHCHRNGTSGCVTCRHNWYLHNGTCLETCPTGYVERRPSWVFEWKREIGRTCAQNRSLGVVAWGHSSYGGNASSVDLSSGVQTIFSTQYAFAALKTDGSVVAWGHSSYGGDASGVTLTNVQTIFSTYYAFAALKTDGSVVAWGNPSSGGDASGVTLTNVQTIFSTQRAFAALKTNGGVVAWGDSSSGGSNPGITSGVQTIFSTFEAFAALKTDGSVVAWGHSGYGGSNPGITSGVQTIFSTNSAFAALKTDGSVVTWGDSSLGGSNPGIMSGVVTIFSTEGAFAALLCETGTYRDGEQCLMCVAGTYSSTLGAASCSICTAGKYSVSGAASCTNCPAGKYLTDDGTFALFHDNVTDCVDCPAGRFSSTPGITTECECYKCDPGSITNLTGQASCSLCLAGTYQSNAGGTTCTNCADEFDSDSGASACFPWKAIVDLPNVPRIVEGSSFSYSLKLAEAPTESVSISITASGCDIATTPIVQMDTLNWESTVILQSQANAPTAKDSALLPCDVMHTISTTDPKFRGRAPQSFRKMTHRISIYHQILDCTRKLRTE
jgi:hypothetical protein